MNKYEVLIDAYMQRKKKRDIEIETNKYTETEAGREGETNTENQI